MRSSRQRVAVSAAGKEAPMILSSWISGHFRGGLSSRALDTGFVRRFPKPARNCEGQMTVEFVVAFPVMLAIALVAMNSLLFFSECASFDRLARQSICVHAAAPAYGKGSGQLAADIRSELQASFDRDWLNVEVEVSGASFGHARYVAILEFTPTLFGRSFSGNAFGVRITPLSHQVSMVVDPYRPGAIV